jgi:hypothetical protein
MAGKKEKDYENKTNKELIEILNQKNKELEKSKNIMADIDSMTKEQLAMWSKMTKDQSVAIKAEAELALATGRRTDAIKAAQEAEKLLQSIRGSSLSRIEDHVAKQNEINELIEKGGAANMAAAEKAQAALDKNVTKHEEIEKNQKKIISNAKDTVKIVEDMHGPLAEISEKWEEFGKGMESTLFGIGEKTIGLVDSTKHWSGALNVGIKMLAADPGKFIEKMGHSFKEVFSGMNMAATMMDKVVESGLEMFTSLDKASSQFAAATGAGSQYTNMLHSMVRTNTDLGLTFENSTAGLQGMLEGLIGFTNESPGMKQALASQAGLLERVGVKAEDSADLMNTFSKTMGLGAQASMEMTKQLAFMGDRIGISSSRMINDFQTSQKTLAVYGKKGVGVFQNLAAGAKAAGVEMGTLLGVAEQFDTFESAAESAGKLNAILGGNLSATQLLLQTEDQRIESVIRQVQISGQSFKDMDRFKQKALASAVGITDMAEANRIFGMSMSQYKGYQKDMKTNELSQKKFAEAVKATVPIQEKLAAMTREFAPDVTKALEYVRFALDGMITGLKFLNKYSGGTFPYIIMALGLTHVATTALGGSMKILTGLFSGLGKVFTMLLPKVAAKIASTWASVTATEAETASKVKKVALTPAVIASLEAETAASGAAAGANWALAGALLAAGLAMLMLGAGIYIAAEGFVLVIDAFTNAGDAAAYAAIGIALLILPFTALMIVMGILVYTGVGPAAAGIFLAMGAAALMLGLGIMLAGIGMAIFVTALTEMGTSGLIAGAAMYYIGLGVLFMGAGMLLGAYALIAFGSAALMSWSAIGMLAVVMLTLGVGVALIGYGLTVVAAGLQAIGEVGTGAATVLLSLGGAFSAMAVGLGVMFAFMSNPLGWVAIAGAMILMATGIGLLVGGISKLDGQKLNDLSNFADKMGVATEIEQTVIAVLAQDVEELKKVADAKLSTTLGALAMLEAYQTVVGIINTKAETKIEENKTTEQKLTLNLRQEIALGKDKKFSEHVKEGMDVVFKPGGGGEAIAETIVAKGMGEASKMT